MSYSSRRSSGAPIAALVGLVVAALVVTGVVWFTGNTWSKVDSASAACVYNGGFIDNKNYKGAVAPGTGRESQGFMSEVIEYPVGIIQYDKSDGLPDVNVSVGGFTQTYSPVLNFTIATYDDDDEGKPQACNLIEQHLRRLDATDFNDDVADSRWVQQFLNVRVAPAVRDTLPRVLSNGDPSDLFLNQNGTRDNAAKTIGAQVTAALTNQLGGNYFCGPSYRYGGSAEVCGTINVVLPEPVMADEDLAIIRAPQEARTKADNDIAVADERARAAKGVAAAKTQEAESAAEQSAADRVIAEERRKSEEVTIANQYLWCDYLVSLGQNCALVKAAENGNFPMVFGADTDVVVPIEVP
jgi:hypothetical protein